MRGIQTSSAAACDRLRSSFQGRCLLCGVRAQSFCGVLDAAELSQLHELSAQRHYEPNELIVEEEASVRQVANVVNGTIKLFKLMPDGRQQITGFLFRGDFLGPMLSGEYATFAEAVTPVELCLFDQERLRERMDRWPHLERRLFEDATNTLDRALDWMLLLGRKTAVERVASFFTMLIDRNGRTGPERAEVEVPMSRGDIADFLGLTMETVSRQISALRKKNLIVAQGPRAFLIPNPELLRDIGEGESGLT